jgi:hypothetical protein
MIERNIGIIADGATDIAIFKKICECILSHPSDNNFTLNYIELKRQTIHDYVDRYCRETKKNNDVCYLTGEQASQFRKSVTNTLYAAFGEFEYEIGVISNKDILLLTTDSETVLASPDDYFRDWRFSISKILWGSIEEFYRAKARDGYTPELLPLVIPVVTFPSTEIFVVAAKDMKKNYGKKPSELKQALYGTTNLQTLRENDLKEKALDFITPDSISKIFKDVPESRAFIQLLSFGR